MLLPHDRTRHARATKIFHRFSFLPPSRGPRSFGSPQTETSTLLVYIGSRRWGPRGRERIGFRARGSLDFPAAVSPRAGGSADDDIASTSSGTQTSCLPSLDFSRRARRDDVGAETGGWERGEGRLGIGGSEDVIV